MYGLLRAGFRLCYGESLTMPIPIQCGRGSSRVATGSRSWQRLSCYALRLALSLPFSRIASFFTLGDVYTGSMYAVRRSATSCDGREVMTAFLACCNAFPGVGGRFGYDEHLTVPFPIPCGREN